MFKITFLSLILATYHLTPPGKANQGPTITESERKYVLDFMQRTKERLINNVKGLTPAQLNFKPDSSSWSVAECVEHITAAESAIMSRVHEGIKGQVDSSARNKVTITTEQLLKRYSDRSDKRKSREELLPRSQFGSHEETLKEFLKQRDANVKFIKNVEQDLKNRVTTFAFGTVDLYQCILVVAAHSERHIMQLEEVMKNPKFPQRPVSKK